MYFNVRAISDIFIDSQFQRSCVMFLFLKQMAFIIREIDLHVKKLEATLFIR